MILRRLSQSLKEQNWAAIWIEFILLVAGVFLGIQVANWNAQRLSDKQSEVFTERLSEDLRVEKWRYNSLIAYYDDVMRHSKITLDALEGRVVVSNEELLISAYRATQYAELAQYRETFDELTSTGNINLIKDTSMRRMAIEIYNTKLYENVKNEGINSRYRVAFRMLVPISIQEVLAENCGDRPAIPGDYDGIRFGLDYPCNAGVPPQEIDAVAQILRSDPTLVGLLRLRIANIRTAISTQMMSDEIKGKLLVVIKEKP